MTFEDILTYVLILFAGIVIGWFSERYYEGHWGHPFKPRQFCPICKREMVAVPLFEEGRYRNFSRFFCPDGCKALYMPPKPERFP